MYHGMINGRLEELTRAADPPFLGAGSTTQPFVRAKDVFLQMAVVKQDGVVAGPGGADPRGGAGGSPRLHPRRARPRQKAELLRELERAVQARRTRSPRRRYADEMVRNFLRQEAMPGIDARAGADPGVLAHHLACPR